MFSITQTHAPPEAGILASENIKTIALTKLGKASLLNRVETKYLLTRGRLEQVLGHLVKHYFVLHAFGTENPYQSLYFDTPNFGLYYRHHAGAKGRYKLRSRRYCVSDSNFFEIKFKDNHGKTYKQRLSTQNLVTSIEKVSDFVEERYPQDIEALAPVLESRYTRITLVSPAGDERVTLDTTLEFHANDKAVSFPALVIAEVKRENRQVSSSFMNLMKAHRVSPHSLSKYCLGVSQLYSVKSNRFKPTIRYLNKLTEVLYA